MGGPRPARIATAALLALLAGCTTPRFAMEAEPPSAGLWLDGKPAGTGSHTRTLPYYGVAMVSAVPPPRAADRAPGPERYLEERRAVALEAPFPQWLFPLDFVVECATAPFRTDPLASGTFGGGPRRDVQLTLPTRPTVRVDKIEEPELEALRTRAREARVAR